MARYFSDTERIYQIIGRQFSGKNVFSTLSSLCSPPPPFCLGGGGGGGGGGGLSLRPKGDGGLDRISIFRSELLGKRT